MGISTLLFLLVLHTGVPSEEEKKTPVSTDTKTSRQADTAELIAIIDAQQKQIQSMQQALDDLRRQVEGLADQTPDDESHGTSPPPESNPHTAVSPRIEAQDRQPLPRFEFGGYATATYERFDWDTDEDRRARADVERFVFEAAYQPSEWFKVEVEFEVAHGGVGAALEFDVFEEFGEFEQEIEKGGEVEIEKMQAEFLFSRPLSLKVGHLILPVGLLNQRHLPSQYFTATREASASPLIPVVWHENGIGIFGEVALSENSYIDYQAQVVNGLDSTGFSSANWVRGGFQEKFEFKVGENPAYVFNLNYHPLANSMVGVSYYRGNTADNRPKEDIDFDAHVNIATVFGFFEAGPVTLRGQFLRGTLENSDLITQANRRLSNNLGVVRTPVARAAESFYLEAGYDISSWFRRGLGIKMGPLDIFARYDHVDSMDEVEELVFRNPRWNRESWTLGFNYVPHPGFVWKLEHNWRTLGTATLNKERTFATSVAFEY